MGKGVIVQLRSDAYEIGFVILGGETDPAPIMKGWKSSKLLKRRQILLTYRKGWKKGLIRVLRPFQRCSGNRYHSGQKWTGGRMVLYPGDQIP